MVFSTKKIDVTFRLGKGTFGESGFNTVKVSGLRCSANITSGDSVTTADLELRIYGLSQSISNSLTILGQDYSQRLSKSVNFVTIEAGDGTGMAIVFDGGIIEAWADLSNPPENFFYVQATTALVDHFKASEPTVFENVNSALLMQTLAAKMDPPRSLENSGVNGIVLRNVVLHGSIYEQIKDARLMADINAIADPSKNVLAIWPRDGTRGDLIPLVSADTGMIASPAFTQFGVQASTLYNPLIRAGGKVAVKSVVQPATGTWYVYLVSHDLETETPGGKWHTHFEASHAPEVRRFG